VFTRTTAALCLLLAFSAHAHAQEQPAQDLEGELGVGLMADEGDGAKTPAAVPEPETPGTAPETSPELSLLDADAAPSEAPAASAWDSSGEIAFEARAFQPDHRKDTKDWNSGLFGRLSLGAEKNHFALRARGFGRADAVDHQRSLAVIEELWAEARASFLSLRVGFDVFNWSATEAFHPADIINARNLDSDIERYEKLGEPMANLTFRWSSGSISAFVMPFRMHPLLPSPHSRMSPVPEGIRLGKFAYLDDTGRLTNQRLAPQGGLVLRQTLGHADLTVHAVHHTDRSQPEVYYDAKNSQYRPLLRTVTQIGGTYQQVLEPVILKIEWAYRRFENPSDREVLLATLKKRDHFQGAVGLEYGFMLGKVESTLIVEAQSIFFTTEEVRKNLQMFQRDALVGYRLLFPDAGASTVNLLGIIDLEDPGKIIANASFTRRLGNDFQISVAARLIVGKNDSTVNIPSNADHLRIFLTRYF
jgi:hypothetical protein